jgi:hypothetical protein
MESKITQWREQVLLASLSVSPLAERLALEFRYISLHRLYLDRGGELSNISLFLSMDLLDFACFISGCIEGGATTVISSTLGLDRFNCFVEVMILFLSTRQ